MHPLPAFERSPGTSASEKHDKAAERQSWARSSPAPHGERGAGEIRSRCSLADRCLRSRPIAGCSGCGPLDRGHGLARHLDVDCQGGDAGGAVEFDRDLVGVDREVFGDDGEDFVF
jgi:hypothetical protein